MTKALSVTSVETIIVQMKQRFGHPPLLKNENPDDYDRVARGMVDCYQPTDFVEQMLVRDMIDATWWVLRYRRYMTMAVDQNVRQQFATEADRRQRAAANETRKAEDRRDRKYMAKLGPELQQRFELERIIDTCIEDVDGMLDQAAKERNDASAFRRSIDYHTHLAKLHSVAIELREDAVRQLDAYRDGLGRQLRQTSDDLIDGKATGVPLALPDNSNAWQRSEKPQ